MASDKQLEANRRNAQRSTGPRTEEGKEQSRANALKHGLRAQSLGILPNEDPEAYEARVAAWFEAYEPRNPAEADLVEHAAELSWRLDRTGRFETTLFTKRVRQAIEGTVLARRTRAYEAYRKLLPNVYQYVKSGSDGLNLDALRLEIEASPEGCRLLLQYWNSLLGQAKQGRGWPDETEFHVIRLLKRDTGDVVTEPEIVEVAVANMMQSHPQIPMIPQNWTDGFAYKFNKNAVALACKLKPESPEEAQQVLVRIASREITRLEGILEARALLSDADTAEAEEAGLLALFDPSPEGERPRRYQSAIRRELTRTLDQLAKLRAQDAKLAKAPPPNCANEPKSGPTDSRPEPDSMPETGGGLSAKAGISANLVSGGSDADSSEAARPFDRASRPPIRTNEAKSARHRRVSSGFVAKRPVDLLGKVPPQGIKPTDWSSISCQKS